MKIEEKKYWKSIEEVKSPRTFKELAKNEFSEGYMDTSNTVSRKKFLKIMGASIALATLSGCRKPVQKIIPYVNAADKIKPGIPNYYASVMPFGLNSFGIIAESHEGRPTHIHGNTNHPESLGATNSFVQASILDLYDPDRSKVIKNNKKISSWSKLSDFLQSMSSQKSKVAILSKPFSSPSLKGLKSKLGNKVDWYCYDPMNDENEDLGIEEAIGKKCVAQFSLDRAQTILSIDSDFLGTDIRVTRNTKDFSKKRKVQDKKSAAMNRLYVIESNFSQTGAIADHRKVMRQSDIDYFVSKLWKGFLGKKIDDKFIKVVLSDLKKNNGVITGGARLSAKTHELITRMNLLMRSKAVKYIEKSKFKNSCFSDEEKYKKLIKKMNKNEIDCLIIFDSNPVYFEKNNQGFAKALKGIKSSIHFGPYFDETASLCEWHVPKSHYLESWGDCQSLSGAVSIIQPLISPLYYQAYSDLDFLHLIDNPLKYKNSKPMDAAYSLIKNTYKKSWNKYLYNGIVKTDKHKSVKINYSNLRNARNLKTERKNIDGIEVSFYLSSQVYDGAFSNNAWLQESPDSMSKIAWDNVAMMSDSTAKKMGLGKGQLLSLKYNEKEIEIPAWVLPGHADGQISLQVGYGRFFKSSVAQSVGKNVFPLMNGALTNNSIKIEKRQSVVSIACTQDHHGMDTDDSFTNNEIQSRLHDIFREVTLEDYKKYGGKQIAKITKDKHLTKKDGTDKTLYKNPYSNFYDAKAKPYNKPYDINDPPQWGMTIDLNSCTGCNACAIACQSENNIPTVGKDEVLKGREMSWVRLDRYFKGSSDNPEVAFQPVSCVHCENAPCEQVCPVAATVHDEEGINAMVYNRCIGTRYCANNCPYKVRRFNFHNYTYDTPEIVQMAHNPDVTIRFRGVMEKCTYCIQILKEAEQKSVVQKKNLNDIDFKVACQSSCPADCIEFGNIKDSESEIFKWKQNDRDYSLLEQLNTKPRTTYLAKLRNPNKELI